ncbi:hypothetical protein [Nonomuraea sp. NPDC002799]
MDRRTWLKGAVAAAVTGPLEAPSRAHAGTYHVALCEQFSNTIKIFPVGAVWDRGNLVWRWTPPGLDTWVDLTDIKFRETSAYGWVALVTASGGKVGIVDIDTSRKRYADVADLLWSARPYGNPHAIERIPNIGAIVTASARDDWDTPSELGGPRHPKSSANPRGGFLTVYGPADSDDPMTLTRVDEFEYPGAHGLWYDGSHLWALGSESLTQYEIVGHHLTTRLKRVGAKIGVQGGHSLDADYSDSRYLLIAEGSTVRRFHKATRIFEPVTPRRGVKSYSRVASGESFWVKSTKDDDTDRTTNINAGLPGDVFRSWVSDRVDFFSVADHTQPAFSKRLMNWGYDGEFYKARVSSTDFT